MGKRLLSRSTCHFPFYGLHTPVGDILVFVVFYALRSGVPAPSPVKGTRALRTSNAICEKLAQVRRSQNLGEFWGLGCTTLHVPSYASTSRVSSDLHLLSEIDFCVIVKDRRSIVMSMRSKKEQFLNSLR